MCVSLYNCFSSMRRCGAVVLVVLQTVTQKRMCNLCTALNQRSLREGGTWVQEGNSGGEVHLKCLELIIDGLTPYPPLAFLLYLLQRALSSIL